MNYKKMHQSVLEKYLGGKTFNVQFSQKFYIPLSQMESWGSILENCLSGKYVKGLISFENIDSSFKIDLWEAIIGYGNLGIHDILKLTMVCKSLAKYLCENNIEISFNLEHFLCDSFKNNCKSCTYGLLHNNYFAQLANFSSKQRESALFLATCRELDLNESMKYYKFSNLDIDTDYMTKCLTYASKRDDENKKKLLFHISNFPLKNNIQALKIFSDNFDEEIIENLVGNIRGPFSDDEMRIILPLYLKIGIVDIYHNTQYRIRYGNIYFNGSTHELKRTNENYLFLLNLIINNIGNYSNGIIIELIHILFSSQNIDETTILPIYKYISTYTDLDFNLVKKMLSATTNINLKLYLVPLAYKTFLSDELNFLNDTKELNILSINNCVNGSGKIYVDKLSEDELIQICINTKKECVRENILEHIKVTAYNPKIRYLINWAIVNDCINCVTHFIHSDYVDIDLKISLVPYMYAKKSSETCNLSFLDSNAKFNELSIREALKNRKETGFIYYSHLDNDTIFKLLYSIFISISYQGNIPSVLIKCIKNDNFKRYDKIFFSDQCDNFTTDSNSVYKLKINNNIYNLDHLKLLLSAIDNNSYRKIYDKIVNDLYKSAGQTESCIEHINEIISHHNFETIKPSRVIALLRLCHFDHDISKKIIINHSFFRKLYMKLEFNI